MGYTFKNNQVEFLKDNGALVVHVYELKFSDNTYQQYSSTNPDGLGFFANLYLGTGLDKFLFAQSNGISVTISDADNYPLYFSGSFVKAGTQALIVNITYSGNISAI